MIRLGVNIDHVATVRQARHAPYPDMVKAALSAARGGADSITVHLREDRRHIQDIDVVRLRKADILPLNLEMSLAEDIVRFACRVRPAMACIVPERRKELTTEGGLDVKRYASRLASAIERLHGAGIEVSLFIEPDIRQVSASKDTGADAVELHTGHYALQRTAALQNRALKKLIESAERAHGLGMHCNAGHGLNYENILPAKKIPHLRDFNIGHSIVAESIFIGLENAVRRMKQIIES